MKVDTVVQQIAVSMLDDPQNALRVEMDEAKLQELERDVRDNGFYVPLIVQPVAERFEVVDGHRRLVVARRIGLETAPCIVRGADDAPPESVKLKCNLLREENTDAEFAIWLGELAEKHGATLDELCKLVGRSESWVNARIDLLRGDHAVLIALGERKINFSQAQAINRCPEASWRAMALNYAIVDNVPAYRLKEWLQRNCTTFAVVPQPTEQDAPSNGDDTAESHGIECAFCGGHKDPQNMVNLWLHRWEWNLVQQALAARQEAMQGGAPGGDA